MKKGIILAPNSFKGSLNTFEVCKIMQEEFSCMDRMFFPFPLGDGGDGTAKVLAHYLGAVPVKIITCDALNRPRSSFYYSYNNTAIIELAEICGLKTLRPEEYDIYNVNTTGLGIAINQAIETGASRIILCLGGSASIDGGTGALETMGLVIQNKTKKYKNHLIDIEQLNTSHIIHKFKDIEFTLLCDVDTVLYGPLGAPSVYGPQKGASPTQISRLNHELQHYATLLSSITGKDISHIPGGGSAGGIAAAFTALFNSPLISGAEYCVHISGLKEKLELSGYIITGEGKLDEQSFYGKIPGLIGKIAQEYGLFSIAVAGEKKGENTVFNKIYTLAAHATSTEDSILHAEKYLRKVCREISEILIHD